MLIASVTSENAIIIASLIVLQIWNYVVEIPNASFHAQGLGWPSQM